MKRIFLISLLFYGFAARSQTTFKAWMQQLAKDCTEETVLKEPGRFWDYHIGGATGGAKSGFSAVEIANAKKIMQTFENIIKPKMQFTGGLAKANFGLNSKPFYNQELVNSYTYNLGFHAFACNMQTHQMAIVDEYQGVLRVTGNPWFQQAFTSFQGSAAAYKNPVNTPNINAPFIGIYNYYAFADSRLVNAINNGNGYIDLTDETAGAPPNQVLENKPGKGYGWNGSNNNFVTVNNEFVYRHAFITHTDIPFFIPVSRKKFLTDLLEFYDREKPELVANMQDKIKNLAQTITESEKRNSSYLQDQKNKQALQEQSAQEIFTVNEQKKQTIIKLLQSKDEKWLSLQATLQFNNKSFPIPYGRNRNLKEVYGDFYFTDFHMGTDALYLTRLILIT